jgi:hypothetical protein
MCIKTQYNVVLNIFPLSLLLFLYFTYLSLFHIFISTWYQSHFPMAFNFPGVRHVPYDCLIIPVVRMSRHAFKIDVSLFHAFIAATSGKIIPESGLQGTDLLIRGRFDTDYSRTCLHVPSKLSTLTATRLQPRPIPSVTVPIDKSTANLSSAVQNAFIGTLTCLHAPSKILDLRFTSPRASTRSQFCNAASRRSRQSIILVTAPLRRFASKEFR